jgi:hypothetical protein
MRKLTRLSLLAAALPLALIASTPSPASAAIVGAGLVQGSGTISPGLGVVPTAQNFSFGGSVTGAIVNGTTPSLSAPCSASGHDLAGSVAEGAGTVNASCAGALLPIGVFVRVGAVVVAAFADVAGGAGGGVFAFQPDQLPPATVTSYHLVGVGAAAHA